MLHGPLFEGLILQDQSLATELVLGVLRHQRVLDAMIERSLSRPVDKLDPEVLIALRLGAYQMRYLDRIPDRAAVSESVNLVKHGPKRSASGLVNAALRNLSARPPLEIEAELAVPSWMFARWERNFDRDAAMRISAASRERPDTYLRLSEQTDLDALVRRLEREGLETHPTEIPTARRLQSGRIEKTLSWVEGLVRIQDISAQLVVPLLDMNNEQRLLDLCAAPGGKTAQAASIRGSSRGIVAADIYAHRLRKMRQLVSDSFDLVVLDAEQALPFRQSFDRILIDAPCSGTGTLARNPDLKWRIEAEDLPALAQRQRHILANALDALSPNGLAVYATCSLEPEENIEVVNAVLAEKPGWRIGQRLERLPGRDDGDGFFAVQILRA